MTELNFQLRKQKITYTEPSLISIEGGAFAQTCALRKKLFSNIPRTYRNYFQIYVSRIDMT